LRGNKGFGNTYSNELPRKPLGLRPWKPFSP
jgi:hypothetical protein